MKGAGAEVGFDDAIARSISENAADIGELLPGPDQVTGRVPMNLERLCASSAMVWRVGSDSEICPDLQPRRYATGAQGGNIGREFLRRDPVQGLAHERGFHQAAAPPQGGMDVLTFPRRESGPQLQLVQRPTRLNPAYVRTDTNQVWLVVFQQMVAPEAKGCNLLPAE
jgi:hypothetical protein